jgi:hypothetical protein
MKLGANLTRVGKGIMDRK